MSKFAMVKNFFFDANEQFDIYFFFWAASNIFICIFSILIFFLIVVSKLMSQLNGNFHLLTSSIYLFIKNTVTTNVSVKGGAASYFLPYFFIVFLFISISNLLGVLTFTYTVTSLLVVPFFLSIINFVFTSTIMIKKYKLFFFGGFLPAGTNLAIAPLLIFIEITSYFIKLISLAVRLFANMFAGHILIKVLLSLAWALASVNITAGLFLAFLIFVLILAILCLELFICVLQAYVFINIASVYLNQSVNFLNH